MQLLRSYATCNGYVVDYEFSDIASGMNEDRLDFNKLIEKCINGEINKIFITYKDRLTRFGFGYIEKFLDLHGVGIVVLNATKEEDVQQELVQDFTSIIHHFSMKMYSNRMHSILLV
jgi:putative resolvase